MRADDQKIIWEFLRLAAHEDSIAAVQNELLLALYAENWGREGDFGCAALHGVDTTQRESVVGVGWARLFSPDAPGFGFLGAHIPEIALAVLPSWRGRGVGRGLLETLTFSAALLQKCESLSLNVRADNLAALHLYRDFGFEKVAGSEILNRSGGLSFTMSWQCSQLNFIANQ